MQCRARRRGWARGGTAVLVSVAVAGVAAACGETDDADRTGDAVAGHGAGRGYAGDPAPPGGHGGRGVAGGGMAGRSGNAGGGGSGGRSLPTPGGASNHAGTASDAGASNHAGESSDAGAPSGSLERCSGASLVWRSANKTTYTSYPDPGSEECIEFNGCTWAGQFAACDGTRPESWVATHNIVAAFPDFDTLELHDLCLRKGDKRMVVTVLDTCGDSDCNGCCTENQGSADELIDIESYTNERWGERDGAIEWADLGPTNGDGCG
jgi:hypothetical protein